MRMARVRAREVLQDNGFSPDAELPLQQVIELMETDSTVMASARAWLAVQQLTWAGIQQLLDTNRDAYLTELRAAESKGPGTLELNTTMHIPDYAKHEIHIMPGGYVGDPLAGYIFHYGTNGFNMGPQQPGRGPGRYCQRGSNTCRRKSPPYSGDWLQHWPDDGRPEAAFPGCGGMGHRRGRPDGALRPYARGGSGR